MAPLFQVHHNSFPRFSPALRKLCIRVRYIGVLDPVSADHDCIRRWQNLQTVDCPRISFAADALVHLSERPALTRLTFMLSTTLLNQIASSNSPLVFSVLRHLTSNSKCLYHISRCLPLIRLPVITDFVAAIGYCPSRQELSLFFASVDRCAGRTIQKLRLTESLSVFKSHPEPERASFSLGLDDLRPCTAFGNLLRIELGIACNVGLTDHDLLEMAPAWPRLECLSINPLWGWGWDTPGGISPDGLLQLLRTCQSLCQIALVLDTRGFTEFVGSPASLGLTFPTHFSVDILDSVIEAESVPAVVAFLAGMGPSTQFTFRAWDGLSMMSPPNVWDYQDRWDYAFSRVHNAVTQRCCHSVCHH